MHDAAGATLYKADAPAGCGVDRMADEAHAVWTVGHSTRDARAFADLLIENRIEVLADVRRFPGSRRHPQFHADALALTLPAAGIDYRPFVSLGGRRKPRPDSRNTAWRNLAFRGYADHMASTEYRDGFAALIALAARRHCVLMCAELLWWQCHRSMIADDLVLHGWQVVHIMGPGKTAAHAFRAPAHLVGDTPVYDDGEAQLL